MKSILIVALSLTFGTAIAQQAGIFTNLADIGSPKLKGATSYSDKTYKLKGGGYNIWFSRDEFHYAYKKIKGDFTLTGSFEFVGKGVDPHRKIGWMVRTAATAESSHVSAVLHGDGLTVLQWRTKDGVAMRDPEDEIFAGKKSYKMLQIERLGNTIIMRAAMEDGVFDDIGKTDAVALPSEVLVGLFICSHNADALEEARVNGVKEGK